MTRQTDLAEVRRHEFGRLAATGCIYLDYTGSALYPASLVTNDACRLTSRVMANPHADSLPSIASTEAMQMARSLTLKFLDADPAEYEVVFTANASAAIRLLAEVFPFRRGGRLVLTSDNHNSMNGMRLAALRRQAAVEYVPLTPELRAQDPLPWLTGASAPSLFGFPAQSNFSGVQHPLEWISQARRRGYQVLLDAAAFVPTSPLSLSASPADFVVFSYYKLFGYPTGVGALVVRREALEKFEPRSYFGGGAVQFVSVQNKLARLKTGSEGFEDGTPNFLAMPAICDGLNWLCEIGMRRIGDHVRRLTRDFLDRFEALGDRIVVYGPRDCRARGGTFAFNLLREGRLLPFEDVERAARERGIAIRGGCFCNPGAAEQAFAIPSDRARACLRGSFSIPSFRTCLGGGPVGAVRASVGVATSDSDVNALVELAVDLTQAGNKCLT